MNNLESAATRYAEIGWAVVPLHTPTGNPDQPCSCHKHECASVGKHPRTRNGVSDATTDHAQIVTWWDMWEDANVGIELGREAGCFALDIDPRNGGDEAIANLEQTHGPLPETRTADTGSGGRHLLFQYPDFPVKNSKGELGPGLDVKSDGGYIVAAPSLHASGQRYRWRNGAPIAKAPEWLLEKLKEGSKKSSSASAEVGEVIPQGKRNETLTSLGGTMRRRGMGAEEIAAALLAVNANRCDPPLSADEVYSIAQSVCRYAPAQPGATGGANYNQKTDDVQVEEADEERNQKNGGGKDPLSLLLIKLALGNSELFHDAGGNCYASVTVNSHRETHKLSSRDYKDWLAGLLYRSAERAASADKLSEATTVLRAKARYESPEIETHVRVAEDDGVIFLDLCDKDWHQIRITEEDWGVIESKDSPIRFRRSGGMLALPEPTRGGELDELRELLNLPTEDSDNWIMLLAWLVATFKPCNLTRIAYPLLAVHGEQGSAKSTTCRLLRRLIDPNKADLRATPKDERDLAIAAEHGRVLGFDNLTYLSDSLSNALCRMATGGGFATRELFTDEGEVIFDSQRPVILNGIAEVVAKSDLLDRSILIYLPQIDRKKRKLDRVIDRRFAEAQPRILGVLLTAVSRGLNRLKQGVTLSELPRMADFAEWVTACERGLGLSEGQFLDAYRTNQEKANGLAIEASPVAQAIIAFVGDCHDWQGTTGGLVRALDGRIEANGENPKKKNGWPQSARALGAKLKEIAPNLRRNGIGISFGERNRRGYTVTLSQAAATDQPEEGKDVHNVHNVHQANGINSLDDEHWREHLENNSLHNVHPSGSPDLGNGACEHCEGELLPNVHTNVHHVNDCKHKAGERCEHCEHLSGTPAPARRRMTI